MASWGSYSDAVSSSTYSASDLLAILASGQHPDGSPFSLNVGSQDAFGRLRVSDPLTLLDMSHQYDEQPLLFDTSTSGSGAAVHVPDEACVSMSVYADTEYVIRQSREYVRYQPGKSQLAFFTFDAGDANANVVQRVGLFDAENGVFVERDAGSLVNVVRRTSTSGSVSDAASVTQDDWNIDPLDGSGPSGYTLDFTKSQIFWIDLEWLGVGTVRCGFVINGALVPVHAFHHANTAGSVYMTTANLPVRYEIRATGTPGAATTTLKQICAAVISEGGFEDDRGFPHSKGLGTSSVAVTTRRPVLSLRPNATFNSITNRSTIRLSTVELYATTNTAYVEIVYDGTLTGADWAATVDSTSAADLDTAAGTISGGTTIWSGYVSATNQSRSPVSANLASKLPLALNIAGDSANTVSVVATAMTGTSNVSANLNWKELR